MIGGVDGELEGGIGEAAVEVVVEEEVAVGGDERVGEGLAFDGLEGALGVFEVFGIDAGEFDGGDEPLGAFGDLDEDGDFAGAALVVFVDAGGDADVAEAVGAVECFDGIDVFAEEVVGEAAVAVADGGGGADGHAFEDGGLVEVPVAGDFEVD